MTITVEIPAQTVIIALPDDAVGRLQVYGRGTKQDVEDVLEAIEDRLRESAYDAATDAAIEAAERQARISLEM